MTWQGDISRADREAFAWLAEVDAADDWEDLLIAETADAILIGRGACGADLRARQVQELARLGRPMLVTFPLFDSVLTYFEVDMSRTEGGAILQYYNPLREVPAVAATLGWIAQGHPNSAAWSRSRQREPCATARANKCYEALLQTSISCRTSPANSTASGPTRQLATTPITLPQRATARRCGTAGALARGTSG